MVFFDKLFLAYKNIKNILLGTLAVYWVIVVITLRFVLKLNIRITGYMDVFMNIKSKQLLRKQFSCIFKLISKLKKYIF